MGYIWIGGDRVSLKARKILELLKTFRKRVKINSAKC